MQKGCSWCAIIILAESVLGTESATHHVLNSLLTGRLSGVSMRKHMHHLKAKVERQVNWATFLRQETFWSAQSRWLPLGASQQDQGERVVDSSHRYPWSNRRGLRYLDDPNMPFPHEPWSSYMAFGCVCLSPGSTLTIINPKSMGVMTIPQCVSCLFVWATWNITRFRSQGIITAAR